MRCGSHTPDRAQVLLRVEHEPGAVDVAIEVNGELRTRATDSETSTNVDGAVDFDDAARHAEVTIKPAVVQDAAVHLDGRLLPP